MRASTDERVREGLRAIAVLEAFKGALALLAGFGVLALIPHNFRHLAVELVGRLHLNPGKHYPEVFLRLLENSGNGELWLVASLVVAYASVRFLEAYGLWRDRPWGEWVAALSGAIYVPFEIFELARHVTWVRWVALGLNLLIVAYMAYALSRRRRRAFSSPVPPSPRKDPPGPSGS